MRSLASRLLQVYVLSLLCFALNTGCGTDMVRPDLERLLADPVGDGSVCSDADLLTRSDDLVVHFIDVGQGDAIWIRTPSDGIAGNGEREGFNILVDAGDMGTLGRVDGGAIVVDYMLAHGMRPGDTIDWVIVSHAHSDHYGGLTRVMDSFTVVNVVDPGLEVDTASYLDFLERAEQETAQNGGRLYRPAIPHWVPERFMSTPSFGAEIETWVLNSRSSPDPRHGSDTVNNSSIVLLMRYAGASVLLTGDAHWEVEAEIADRFRDLRVNILKVGHHGSRTSSANNFLRRAFDDVPRQDRYAVIQAGRRAFSGVQHPTVETVFRLTDFVPLENLYSTEYGDAGLTEEEAAGDDHILAVISSRGDVRLCYNRSVVLGLRGRR